MHKSKSHDGLVVVSMLVLAASWSGTGASADNWLGFRGSGQQGVANDGSYPVSWNVDTGENIIWSSPIRGLGHSSPVISGDSVFVTSAYLADPKSTAVSLAKGIVELASFLLLVVVAHWVLQPVFRPLAKPHFHTNDLLLRVICSVAAVFAVSMIHFGGQAFDYDRCPIRSWLGSTMASGFVIVVATCVASHSRPIRIAMWLVSAILTLLIIWLVPASDHIFRHGVFGPQVVILLAAALAPLLGVTLVALLGSNRRGDHSRLRAILCCALVAVSAMSCLGVPQLARATNPTYPGDSLPLRPFFPASVVWGCLAIGCSVLALGLAFVFHRPRRVRFDVVLKCRQSSRSSRLGLLFVLMGSTGTVVGLSGVVLNALIGISPFLQYQLPPPDWTDLGTLHYDRWVWGLGLILLTMASCDERLFVVRRCAAVIGVLSAAAIIPAHLYLVNWNIQRLDFVRAVIALDATSGEAKWVWEGFPGAAGQVHRENSHATPTVMVADNRVVAYFGTAGLVCLDADSGNEHWTRRDVPFESVYGAAVSPVVADGKVLLVCDAPQRGDLYAIDLITGETVWQHDRSAFWTGRPIISGHSGTPLVLDVEHRPVLVVWGWKTLTGYDVSTGQLCFQYPFPAGGDRVASPTSDGMNVYFGIRRELVALSVAQIMEPTSVEVWRTRANVNCVTPISNGQHLYAISDQGVITCIDVADGKRIWQSRLQGEFRSSPIVAGGHLYAANVEGLVFSGRADGCKPEWSVVDMRSPIFATMAAVNRRLYVRTETTLLCIEEQTRNLADVSPSSRVE